MEQAILLYLLYILGILVNIGIYILTKQLSDTADNKKVIGQLLLTLIWPIVVPVMVIYFIGYRLVRILQS